MFWNCALVFILWFSGNNDFFFFHMCFASVGYIFFGTALENSGVYYKAPPKRVCTFERFYFPLTFVSFFLEGPFLVV